MTVLDTSFIIDVLRNKPHALKLLDELDKDEMLIPSPAVMELWEGALGSTISKEEKKRVDEMLTALTVADFDTAAAKRAAEVSFELRHNPIEPEDTMIAGIALSRGETLITRDAHFAQIPGLRMLKY